MMQMFELFSRIHALFHRALLPVFKAEHLTKTEMFILMRVYRKKMFRATDLARNIDMPFSTFTGIVDRLIAKNYLTREIDPEDRRSVLIQGTPELTVLMKRIDENCEAELVKISKNVPDDFYKGIMSDLSTFYEYLAPGTDGSDTPCHFDHK